MPDGPPLPLSVDLRQAHDESDLTVQPPPAAKELTAGEQPSVEPPSTIAEHLLPAGSQLELRFMSMPLQVLFVFCLIHLCLALAGVGYVDPIASVPLDRSFVSSPADPLHPRN